MKIIKITSKNQITIPKIFSHLCHTGFLSATIDEDVLTLRPVELEVTKTDEEIIAEIMASIKQKQPG